MNKLILALSMLKSVSLIKFVRYNFLSRCIVREKGCYLMTYRNCIIDLHRESRIFIKGGTIQLGASKLPGSRAETYLRLAENARWICNGDAVLFFNTMVDVHQNGILETGYFTANCGTVIVCAKKITLGDNIMMGRNIILYDSDFHQIKDRHGHMINYDDEVTIGENVWLTSNVTVMRGVTIGEGSIVGPQTVVKKDLPAHSFSGGYHGAEAMLINKSVTWTRESTH